MPIAVKFYNERSIKSLGKNVEKVDLMELFLKDIFEYRYPHLYKRPHEKEYMSFRKEYLKQYSSAWIHYPWLGKVFKIPYEEEYIEVLTSRNKPYVSIEEQKNFYGYNVGIVGLSVGQSTALTIVRGGGSKNIKIADPDVISPNNLNRLNVGIDTVGKRKTDEVTKLLYGINPFLNIKVFDEGLVDKNQDDFFSKEFKLDVVVDACDDFITKFEIRRLAAKYGIPVIMATDVGDGSLIEIERYDKKQKIEPFGGRHKLVKDPQDFFKAAVAIISPENIPLSLQDRFIEIGKTTPTHPQLANSVYFSATLVSYLIRCLANNRDIVDERVFVDYDELFDPKYKQDNFKKIKEEKINAFKSMLGME